jgi:hypothetical protein
LSWWPAAAAWAALSWPASALAQQTPAAAPPSDGDAAAAPAIAGSATAAGPSAAEAPSALPEATASAAPPTASATTSGEAALAARLDEQEKRLAALEERTRAAEDRAAAAEATAAAALDAGTAEGEATAESRLRFYGFADMAFRKIYVPEESHLSGLIDDSSSFALGNVNLYIDATPVDEFRALAEVRFTLYPWGTPDSTFAPTDTTVFDTTSATGRNKVVYSGIVLERAHLEWTKYDAFRVLFGYFLTPYGLWNVDHGSPTLISSVLPGFWASELFPTRQLGVQALGDFFSGSWQFGYRAYVSNGRTPGQLDVDKNKHLGGQVYAAFEGPLRAKLGASGFWGQNAYFVKSIASVDPFRVATTKDAEYTEFGLGADLSVDYKALRLRGEFVAQREDYTDGLRPATSPVTEQADRTRLGAYGILAYRLPAPVNLEPYVFVDYDQRPTTNANATLTPSGGLIWHVASPVQLKFQAYHVMFLEDDTFPDASSSNITGWDTRLVAAF